MARIKGVPPAHAGLYVKMAYYFTRRGIAKLTGRETERMIEPLEIYAHVPVLFKGYAKLEQATARLHRLDTRLHLLAELKAATLTQCEYCIDMGSAISRRLGLTDQEILALPHYQTSPLFSELDKLVLDYAVGMSRTPRQRTGPAVWQAPPASRRRPTCGANPPHRTGEHARPLQPGARHRPSGLQRRHGVRRPCGSTVSSTPKLQGDILPRTQKR